MLPLLFLALSCAGCRPKGPVVGAESQAPPELPVPAGELVEGRFVDRRWGFSLDLPEGWTAEPGPDAGSLRVRLVDQETGARVELWAFVDLDQQPRPRADCEWTWVGTGRFRVPRGPAAAPKIAAVTSATCTPEDPQAPRVYAWLLPGQGVGIQAEIHVPVDRFLEGRHRGEALLRGLRL